MGTNFSIHMVNVENVKGGKKGKTVCLKYECSKLLFTIVRDYWNVITLMIHMHGLRKKSNPDYLFILYINCYWLGCTTVNIISINHNLAKSYCRVYYFMLFDML